MFSLNLLVALAFLVSAADASIEGPSSSPHPESTLSPTPLPSESPSESPTPLPCKVTGFNVFNPANPPSPTPILDFGTISLTDYAPTCKINIEAETVNCIDDPVECVEITLGTQSRKEQEPLYYLYGDNNGVVFSGTPQTGTQILRACAYTDKACTVPVSPDSCLTETVTVVGGGFLSGFQISNFGNTFVRNLTPSPTNVNICLNNPSTVGLTIEAEPADACVNKVFLKLTGNSKTVTRTENGFPFYVFGDTLPGGTVNYSKTFVANKQYTIEATPNGITSNKITATFTFVSAGTPGCI